MTHSIEFPIVRTYSSSVPQYDIIWRNSLLAFPGIWSNVETANAHHMKLYLAGLKTVPLHVTYLVLERYVNGIYSRNAIGSNLLQSSWALSPIEWF